MRRILLTALMMTVLAVALSLAGAAAPLTKVVGTVSVTEDDDWNITSVKLTVDEKTAYQVVLDENGRKLGTEMDGLKVEVEGTVVDKNGAKWLTVAGYKEIEEVDG